jgi:hypothetical protein
MSDSSLWLRAAWEDDLARKIYVMFWRIVVIYLLGIHGKTTSGSERQTALKWVWFLVASSAVNFAALWFEQRGPEIKPKENDRAGCEAYRPEPRELMEQKSEVEMLEDEIPEAVPNEMAVSRRRRRRDAISDQEGTGPAAEASSCLPI